MKLFDLRDKNYNLTELFRIEEFSTIEEVINKLNNWLKIKVTVESYSLYTSDVNGKNYKYVYVSGDGHCHFVESLIEFIEGFISEQDWGVEREAEVPE